MFVRGRLDQSSSPHSNLPASQSPRREKQPDSDSISPYDNPESSESVLSDERSIYNAIRVTTPNDSSPRFYASLAHDNPVHEQGLAVNMAKFATTDSQDDHTLIIIPGGKRQRMAGKLGNHAKLLSDQYWQATQRRRCPLSRTASVPDPHRSLNRKAVSLDTNDSIDRPKWPGCLGPAVMTVQPRYPPPERKPTPPGLPSFGTSEAMSYSAQFMLPDNGVRPPTTLHCGGLSGSQRGSSYGDTLRRFFGFSSSTSHTGGISVNGIGRAEDGTLVQGRFPHRQSGHGMSIGRQLHEHPFHQRNLPIAQPEVTDTSHDSHIEAAHTKGDLGARPGRRVQPPASPSRRHFPFTSSPTPAVVSRAPRHRDTGHLGVSCNSLGSDGPTDSVESSAQGTRATGDHIPPHPSRLHSVLTIVRGGADEGPHASTPICPDVLSWVKSQTCLCCCSGSQEEQDDSLGATSSRETYVTAQSQPSPAGSQNENSEGNTRFHGLQAWISSLYGAMFPAPMNPTAV
ncbi:uncharacterized protein PGRI_064070 [Penicillium griseofulvum]|uniref:Uncharacterized protein n=1 Tax=Penicillium patulum TaxID=5078 RepID=A0A135LPD6_PENPA|nr:uncharacterized protein PGRI_064070 [Penicillium griseofulvum]KXG50835.1 hypothetical protein PGRI_064070 [Penicillium griseofulvum]